MLVFALVTVYVACAAVLVAVLLQDRSGTRRRDGAPREPCAPHASEWVFRTQA